MTDVKTASLFDIAVGTMALRSSGPRETTRLIVRFGRRGSRRQIPGKFQTPFPTATRYCFPIETHSNQLSPNKTVRGWVLNHLNLPLPVPVRKCKEESRRSTKNYIEAEKITFINQGQFLNRVPSASRIVTSAETPKSPSFAYAGSGVCFSLTRRRNIEVPRAFLASRVARLE